jgi:hypothetical protein
MFQRFSQAKFDKLEPIFPKVPGASKNEARF